MSLINCRIEGRNDHYDLLFKAFASGVHKRLGARSPVLMLPGLILVTIFDHLEETPGGVFLLG